MKKKIRTLFRLSLSSGEESNAAYALLRVFVGAAFIVHGSGKVFGGFDRFSGHVAHLGLPFPVFLALMAAIAEFFGGGLLITGLLTRVFSFLIFCTMLVAAFVVHGADPFMKKELALVYLFCALLFMLKGAGTYSLDRLLSSRFPSPPAE